MSSVPVLLYIPNILGYVRIILAFYGLHLSATQPVPTILVFLFSASLDLLDGILARRLDQTSSFGVLLDIAADNILRTCGWIAAAVATCKNHSNNHNDSSSSSPLMIEITAAAIICVEWITMLCTQLHAAHSEKHWKSERDNDPRLVRALFANNFCNPIGIISIYGIFSSSLWIYGSQYPHLYQGIPMFDVFKHLAFFGRFLGLAVEFWMIQSYVSLIIRKDAQTTKAKD